MGKITTAFCIFFSIYTFSTVWAALQCYQCEWSEYDTSCFDNVGNATIVSCPNNYCGVAREDDLDAGNMTMFQRTCYDFENNEVYESYGKRVSSQTCSSDLCNTGDGIGGALSLAGSLPAAVLMVGALVLERIIL